MTLISLEYGSSGHWQRDFPGESLLHFHLGPDPHADPSVAVNEGIQQPLEFPSLELAMVPGDRVVVVLDRNIPSAAEIIRGVCWASAAAGVDPENLLILQPASMTEPKLEDPRRLLPADVREKVSWKIHDPTLTDGTGYLASSAAGERLYLSRDVLDADFVLPISRFGYDAMLGRRELTSAFYPGLSTPDAFVKALGQGHQECRTGRLSGSRTARSRRPMGRRSVGVRIGRIRSTCNITQDRQSGRTRMGWYRPPCPGNWRPSKVLRQNAASTQMVQWEFSCWAI